MQHEAATGVQECAFCVVARARRQADGFRQPAGGAQLSAAIRSTRLTSEREGTPCQVSSLVCARAALSIPFARAMMALTRAAELRNVLPVVLAYLERAPHASPDAVVRREPQPVVDALAVDDELLSQDSEDDIPPRAPASVPDELDLALRCGARRGCVVCVGGCVYEPRLPRRCRRRLQRGGARRARRARARHAEHGARAARSHVRVGGGAAARLHAALGLAAWCRVRGRHLRRAARPLPRGALRRG
jgi:hypothetical protein